VPTSLPGAVWPRWRRTNVIYVLVHIILRITPPEAFATIGTGTDGDALVISKYCGHMCLECPVPRMALGRLYTLRSSQAPKQETHTCICVLRGEENIWFNQLANGVSVT